MTKQKCGSHAEYIAAQPKDRQRALRIVRAAIRKALPKAEEVISYQMPAFKLGGNYVLYFAGWTRHLSLYPASPALIAAFKDELADFVVRKGTIRFALSEALPVALIGRIAKFRATEVAQRADARSSKKKRSKRS